ncbi:MAG: hypothetical protein ACYTGC_03950, partial [Planctomycetota bacterium]
MSTNLHRLLAAGLMTPLVLGLSLGIAFGGDGGSGDDDDDSNDQPTVASEVGSQTVTFTDPFF